MIRHTKRPGERRYKGRLTDYNTRGIGYQLKYCPECGEKLKGEQMNKYNADYKMVLGTNIKSIIKEKGISQRELADKVNTTETSISRYISGSRTPKVTILHAIAKVLDVTMDDLMRREQDK